MSERRKTFWIGTEYGEHQYGVGITLLRYEPHNKDKDLVSLGLSSTRCEDKACFVIPPDTLKKELSEMITWIDSVYHDKQKSRGETT